MHLCTKFHQIPRQKIFRPKKHQRGKPSKFFGSTKKKKIYLTNVVEPANRSQHTKLFRVQVFSYELLSFMSWGHICHPTMHVRVKPSICMNSRDHWLQVLKKAFPQEITKFLTNFDFAKVNFASQPCMWGLKVLNKICSV